MIRMLASVMSKDEAMLVLEAGADIIDLKNPLAGALGALPLSTIGEITRAIAGRKLVSATIGDLPMHPQLIATAVERAAATGVDFIKIGFFTGDHAACLQALKPLAEQGLKLIAVLFADQMPEFDLLPKLQAAGFYGVMLDTSSKDGSHLQDHVRQAQLQKFVHKAHELKLCCGLAGSLQKEHVPDLVSLKPDYLGFRGALCLGLERKSGVEREAVEELCKVLYKSNTSLGMRQKAEAV